MLTTFVIDVFGHLFMFWVIIARSVILLLNDTCINTFMPLLLTVVVILIVTSVNIMRTHIYRYWLKVVR